MSNKHDDTARAILDGSFAYPDETARALGDAFKRCLADAQTQRDQIKALKTLPVIDKAALLAIATATRAQALSAAQASLALETLAAAVCDGGAGAATARDGDAGAPTATAADTPRAPRKRTRKRVP